MQNQILPRLSSVPGGAKLKGLIEDYEEVLGTKKYESADIGQGNAGISAFLAAQKAKDFSLVVDATKFYSEVLSLDKQRLALLKKDDESVPLGLRSSLADRAGDSRSANIYPGWAWDLAMKHAGGDPNRAMRLIGLCGHDDTAQEDTSRWPDITKQQLEALRAAKLQAAMAEQASVRDLIQRTENDPGSLSLRSSQRAKVLPELRNALAMAELASTAQAIADIKENRSPYACPLKTSIFYHPESLGSGVKTPDDLKTKLVWTQARGDYVKGDRRGETLPAKSYHIYGAAMVSCEMIGRGYPPILVKQLQGWIAWAYRTQRMTSDLARYYRPQARKNIPKNKPWPERTEEEWLAKWKDNEKAFANGKKTTPEDVRNKLDELKSTFEHILKKPDEASWNSERVAKYPAMKAEAEGLKKAFERYRENPNQNPYDPPLSYDEFKEARKADAQRGSETVLGGPAYVARNLRPAYRDYLAYLKIIAAEWPAAKVTEDSVDIFTPFKPAFSSGFLSSQNLHSFASVDQFKRDQLERWFADEQLQKEVSLEATKPDAAYLLQQATLSGPRKIAGHEFTLPTTDIGFPFPTAFRNSALEKLLSTAPEGWSPQRHERARDMVDSWLVDWEWTVAQHQAGAEFAAKNCRPKNPKPKGAETPAAEPAESSSSPADGISAK